MGYESFEQPMIRAFLYYYDNDNCTSFEFNEKFILALKEYGYDSITNVELGKQKLNGGIWEDYVVRYNKKDMLTLNLQVELSKWVNANDITYISLIHKEKRQWLWDITWHKNYKMPDGVSISDYTFNYLTVMSSYDGLEGKDAQNAYVGLFCELADLFEAFYGNIEDVAEAVEALDRTKEKVFNHKRIQTVYWGNYFGKHYCSKIGNEKFEKAPVSIVKATNRGVFLAVTNNLLDCKNNFNFRKRNKLFRYLTKGTSGSVFPPLKEKPH